MNNLRAFIRKLFTPVTIMLIPHSDVRSIRLKMPWIGIFISLMLCFVGTVYIFSMAVDTFEYNRMKQRLNYYSSQFLELKSTIAGLKKADSEFRKIFSLKSKEKILENIDTSDSGSIDMESLKQQIKLTMERVGEIRDYLSQQRDIYVATPRGWPVSGNITSPYGKREHPKTGEENFHTGVDIAADPGTPVRATADGIISFADWSGANGNLVAIEHGLGFSTYYAHNKMLCVKVGQKVKRGDIISYIGSTGNSTGPHVHYEVWKDGKPSDPVKYINGRS